MFPFFLTIAAAVAFVIFWAFFYKSPATRPKTEQPESMPAEAEEQKVSEEPGKAQASLQAGHGEAAESHSKKTAEDEDEFTKQKENLVPKTLHDRKFHLPYFADDIIGNFLKLKMFRRALLNAENYAEKGIFNTAASMYEGVKSRIRDARIRAKIDANILYLETYENSLIEEEKEKEKQRLLDVRERRKTPGFMPLPSAEELASALAFRHKSELDDVKNRLDSIQKEKEHLFDELSKLRAIQEQKDKKESDSEELIEINKKLDDLNELKSRLNELDQKLDEPKQLEKTSLFIDSESLTDLLERIAVRQNEFLKQFMDEVKRPEQKLIAPPEPEPVVEEAEPEPVVKEAEPEPVVEEAEPEPVVEEAEPEPVVEEAEPEPVVKEAEPEPVVEEAEPEPVVEEAEPEPVVEEAEPEPVVEKTEPEPVVEEAEPEPVVEEAEPELIVEEAEPEPVVEKTGINDDEIFEQALSGEKEWLSKFKPQFPLIDFQLPNRKENDDDFDFLQNIIKEESRADKMSDDEVYQKLVTPPRKELFEDHLEIIGENKGENFKFINEGTRFSKEDELFFRNLLSGKQYRKEIPVLRVSYDFKNLPEPSNLSKENNMIGIAFNKYKPMLQRATELIKRRKVREAINYYQVVMSQNIPTEFKSMIRRNINDLYEYLERYMSGD